jgi:hypothetical protein
MQTYCSQSDVENLLSSYGVKLRLDDDGDGISDSGKATAVLEMGANEYNRYVRQRYSVAELAPNGTAADAVRFDCAIICARWACIRRGNPVPDSIKTVYDEVVEFLKSCGSPTSPTIIPGVVSECAKGLAPATRNYGVDLRHRNAIIRVQRATSMIPPDRQPEHVEEEYATQTIE